MRCKFRTIFPLINTQKTTIISLIRNKSIILGKLQTNRPMNHNLYQWIKEQKNSNLYQDNIFATILNGSEDQTNNEWSAKDIFLFALVTDGKCNVILNERNMPLQEGSIVIQTPSINATYSHTSNKFQMHCLCLKPYFFDSLPAGVQLYNQFTGFIQNHHQPVLHLGYEHYNFLRNTTTLFEKQLTNYHLHPEGLIRYLTNFYLMQIANILYENNIKASAPIKHSNEIYREFRKLLLDNYRQQHQLTFYSDKLSITPTYLSRIVKRITGQTVFQHLTELICADAREMLATTDTGIKEITDILGFNDQSSFGKFFKKHAGVSPTQFRMEQGKTKG